MAKVYGTIGYVRNIEIRPGVYKEEVTERNYSGDLIRNIRQLEASDKVNDDINISNEISICCRSICLSEFSCYEIR